MTSHPGLDGNGPGRTTGPTVEVERPEAANLMTDGIHTGEMKAAIRIAGKTDGQDTAVRRGRSPTGMGEAVEAGIETEMNPIVTEVKPSAERGRNPGNERRRTTPVVAKVSEVVRGLEAHRAGLL